MSTSTTYPAAKVAATFRAIPGLGSLFRYSAQPPDGSLRDRLATVFADHDLALPEGASPRCCRRASLVMFSTR